MIKFNVTMSESKSEMDVQFAQEKPFVAKLNDTIGVVTNDYESLKNKPKINGIELDGNRAIEDFAVDKIGNDELRQIIDSQFDLVFKENK